MKPRGLWGTTFAMAVLNLEGLIGIQWNHYGVVAAVVLLMALGYVVLWYYWQGRNWARILVMLTSVVAVLDLATIRRPYRSAVLYDSLIVAEAILGIFLLYWLNTNVVRVWFNTSPKRS